MKTVTEIIENYNQTAKKKVSSSVLNTFLLSVLAGIFIAIAGIGCTFGSAYIGKWMGAAIFPAGLVMVVIGGGKLFTGDCLLFGPLFFKKIHYKETVRTLCLVYLGNFSGAVLVALLASYSGALDGVENAVISTALSKSSLSFSDAFLKGILCNILVCIAVWLTFTTDSVAGKILSIFFPIFIFVLAGFEHSIANMYFIPAGIFMDFQNGSGNDLAILLQGLYKNLIPVTLGNILGGCFVSLMYYFSMFNIRREGKSV